MRLLIISYAFPPYNSIGAVRISKMVKYLLLMGHDVRVLTSQDQPFQPTLSLEIPPERVLYSKWLNVRRPVEASFGESASPISKNNSALKRGWTSALKESLKPIYRTILYFPDANIGWWPYAVPAASRLIAAWRPDLILASATPFTSLLVAHSVGHRHGIPWVADLRDLWVDNHYYDYPNWRRMIEERLERRVLSSAAGFVTVSEPLAQTLREKYAKPTTVVLNGFDPADYPAERQIPFNEGRIRILYTGVVYEGKRNPTPLFEALGRLGQLADKVRVCFYGPGLGVVREWAAKQGVEHLVEVNDPIPYKQSLKSQTEADILLLLLWSDPTERGVYTGKLFEYIGARRPILTIGSQEGVAAELVKKRQLGFVANDPMLIASQLERWIEQKRKMGAIPDLPEDVVAGLSREEQTKVLEEYLSRVCTENVGRKVRLS